MLAAGWCNSGGFSRAWDDVVERQRRLVAPRSTPAKSPHSRSAVTIMRRDADFNGNFHPPESRTARVISHCLRSGCLKPHSRERQPFQKSNCDWRIPVVSPVVSPRNTEDWSGRLRLPSIQPAHWITERDVAPEDLLSTGLAPSPCSACVPDTNMGPSTCRLTVCASPGTLLREF